MATSRSSTAQTLTLDEAREYFYVAQRACERFSEQLRALVADLDSKQVGEAWLEKVQQEASKAVHFHAQQHDSFVAWSKRTDEYVDSVRRLAADLAMQELKGDQSELTDDQQARTVHPELAKFKAEKQARILGKLGGVPALGPGTVLPVAPRGQVLRATESPAAREIHYSRVEDKDSRYLANVFQFKKHSEGPATASSPWQEEVTQRRGQFVSESSVDVPSSTQLATALPCAAELSGVLQQRQAALAKAQQEDAEAAAAAAAAAAQRAREAGTVSSTTPKLAEKLQRRQQELAAQLAQQRGSSESGDVAAGGQAAGGRVSGLGSANPLVSELAGVLQKRNSRPAAESLGAAASGSGSGTAGGSSSLPYRTPSASAGPATADSELAQVLRKRQSLMSDAAAGGARS